MPDLTPMDRYLLRALAQRSRYDRATLPARLAPNLVAAGYLRVERPDDDPYANLTDEGRKAGHPPPLSASALKRRGIRLRDAEIWREAIRISSRDTKRSVLGEMYRASKLWDECLMCRGLGVIVKEITHSFWEAGTDYRRKAILYPRARPEDFGWSRHRGIGWDEIGSHELCACRIVGKSERPKPERDPRVDPMSLDIVGYYPEKRVVAVWLGQVGWATHGDGRHRYTEGVWPLERWRKWAKSESVLRWQEDWTIPKVFWPRPWSRYRDGVLKAWCADIVKLGVRPENIWAWRA